MPPLKNRSYVSQRTIDDLWPRMQAAGEPARAWGAWPWRELMALLAALLWFLFICVGLPLLLFVASALDIPFPADLINMAAALVLWCGVLGGLLARKDRDRVDRVLGSVCLIYLPLPAALTLMNPDPRFVQAVLCGFAAMVALILALPEAPVRDVSRIGWFVRRAAQVLCVVALGFSLLFVLPVGTQLYAAFPERIIASNLLLIIMLLYLVRSLNKGRG